MVTHHPRKMTRLHITLRQVLVSTMGFLNILRNGPRTSPTVKVSTLRMPSPTPWSGFFGFLFWFLWVICLGPKCGLGCQDGYQDDVS